MNILILIHVGLALWMVAALSLVNRKSLAAMLMVGALATSVAVSMGSGIPARVVGLVGASGRVLAHSVVGDTAYFIVAFHGVPMLVYMDASRSTKRGRKNRAAMNKWLSMFKSKRKNTRLMFSPDGVRFKVRAVQLPRKH